VAEPLAVEHPNDLLDCEARHGPRANALPDHLRCRRRECGARSLR
jgi:hypothetical protein